MQLALAKKYHLPLFLHSRAAHVDFVQILKEEGFGGGGGTAVGGRGGVVHSFTGTAAEVVELVCASFKGLGSMFADRVVRLRWGSISGIFSRIWYPWMLTLTWIPSSVNGCGLKSEENLEGVKAIPVDRLMLETG